jgi:hypothetical protein
MSCAACTNLILKCHSLSIIKYWDENKSCVFRNIRQKLRGECDRVLCVDTKIADISSVESGPKKFLARVIANHRWACAVLTLLALVWVLSWLRNKKIWVLTLANFLVFESRPVMGKFIPTPEWDSNPIPIPFLESGNGIEAGVGFYYLGVGTRPRITQKNG